MLRAMFIWTWCVWKSRRSRRSDLVSTFFIWNAIHLMNVSSTGTNVSATSNFPPVPATRNSGSTPQQTSRLGQNTQPTCADRSAVQRGLRNAAKQSRERKLTKSRFRRDAPPAILRLLFCEWLRQVVCSGMRVPHSGQRWPGWWARRS